MLWWGQPLAKRPQEQPVPLAKNSCRALMFPGGRSFNGAVECCFYTRFISTVNSGTEPLSGHALHGNEPRCSPGYALTPSKGFTNISITPGSPRTARREGREALRSPAGFVMGLGEPGFKKRFECFILYRGLHIVLPGGTLCCSIVRLLVG